MKTQAVRYIREPVKRCETQVSIVIQPKVVKQHTMILVIATKARMNLYHVCLRPAKRIVDRECVNRIPAAKDRNEQQTLQTHISKVSLPGRRNRRRM